MLPQSLTNEAVKTRMDKPVGTRSCEVVTEDVVRYRRNGRHLRKGRESYSRGRLTHNSTATTNRAQCVLARKQILSVRTI